MSEISTIRTDEKTNRYLANASHLALAVGCAALASLVSPSIALAVVLEWTGTTSPDWFTGSNWNAGTIPTLADSVVINTATSNGAQIDGGAAAINGNVSLGYDSTASLTISNGGSLTSGAVTLGNIPGGNGAATIRGAGSAWTANSDITVGYRGVGALNVLNGGVVDFSSSHLSIAERPSGVGSVVVDGAGSVITGSAVLVGSSGVGSLMVSNGGKLIGFGNTSSIGQFVNSTGVATITGAGSSWTITGNSLLVGERGAGTLTLADGGVFSNSNSTLVVGAYAGSTGTINIGGVVGATPIAPGAINVPVIFLGSGGIGTLNLNHTSSTYILDQEIFGNGTINQMAGVTSITGDAHGLTGATNVTGGRLAVNSSLGSTVNVSGGGILGGTGTVGGINAINGGIIAPGNSIGTLNVNGNVTFAAGSIYQVETNAAGQSDRIAATGTATLNGGTVVATGVAPLGTKYTILTAAGGISGAFADATGAGALPFMGYGLTYDASNVYLSFGRSSLAFASVGLTRNQIAAGSGADSLTLGSPLVGSLVQLDLAQARAAFDQISGEVYASAKGVMIEDSRFVREAAIDRLRSTFDGVGAVAAPVTAYVDGKPVLAAATTDHLAVWGRGFGSWGQWNGDGNAATIKRDIGGFMIGTDATALDGWRLGMLGGYSRSILGWLIAVRRAAVTTITSACTAARSGAILLSAPASRSRGMSCPPAAPPHFRASRICSRRITARQQRRALASLAIVSARAERRSACSPSSRSAISLTCICPPMASSRKAAMPRLPAAVMTPASRSQHLVSARRWAGNSTTA